MQSTFINKRHTMPGTQAFSVPLQMARTGNVVTAAICGTRRRLSAMSAVAKKKTKAKKNETGGTASSNVVSNLEITPRHKDYSQWYQDVIYSSELADLSPVKGCLVIRPHGFEIWERIREDLDQRIKRSGAKNAYFPLLIPKSFLSKEAEHVDGFSKECAVVTHHRLRPSVDDPTNLEPDPESELEEPLIIRPTSETIIWHMFAKWIHSYRSLPLLINQWANVVRWELRTRPFLRSAEFLWQEGHTAHATEGEAIDKTREMIAVYRDVAEQLLAIPVVVGEKTAYERFPGGLSTLTIEAVMQNGWALQAGTSHFLGETFAKAFDVTYKDAAGVDQYVWATSWGMTTRMLGALIMTHSDDTGLVLPPSVAPIQIAIVLIFKNEQQRATVITLAEQVETRLTAIGIRVYVDDRPNMRPGAKYYEWERKGVPLRMEIGPKDAAKGAVFTARRCGGAKVSIAVDDHFEMNAQQALDAVHTDLFEAAKQRLQARTFRPASYEQMKQQIAAGGDQLGLFLVPWKNDTKNEIAVKEETKATIRCYPLQGQEEAKGRSCIYSGEAATHMAIFARAF